MKKIVINTNILFSIFKKESATTKVFQFLTIEKKIELYSPILCLRELIEIKEEIYKKAKISLKDFIEILNEILSKGLVKFVPEIEYEEYFEKAKEISPDPKDVDIFALALKLNCPIWSNDKELKKQNVIKVYSTKELIEKFR